MKEPVSLDLFPDDVCPTDSTAARRQHKLVSRFDRADVKRRAFLWYLDFRIRLGEYSLLSDHTAAWLDDYLRWHLDALGGLGGVW